MAMKDGKWEMEDDSVSKRVDAITKSGSPLMKSAETKGLQTAARRGLGNSSIAIGAAQKSVIETATPIASQEASQVHQRNITGMGIEDAQTRQKVDNTAQMERLSFSTAAQERVAAADRAAQTERLTLELGSREKLQAAQAAAEKERLGIQLSAQEKLATQELAAAEKRLQAELNNRSTLAAADIASREKIAANDVQSRSELAVAELNSREKIAGAQLAASDRQSLLQSLNQSSQTYADTLQAIMSNPKIPAATREAYMRNAQVVMQRNTAAAEYIFGVELGW